jgi:dihydrofolate reductase
LNNLSLIVAMDEGGLIGRDGRLPWHMPEDLKHFRRLTMGKTMLMGRRTWDSLGGKPLDGRTHWVLSRDPSFQPVGARAFRDLDAALAAHENRGHGPLPQGPVPQEPVPQELMVIGGAELFRATLPLAQRIYLTRVHTRLEGDTWFPLAELLAFRETSREERPADARHAWPYTFATLER